jgi:hypothetical protein
LTKVKMIDTCGQIEILLSIFSFNEFQNQYLHAFQYVKIAHSFVLLHVRISQKQDLSEK